MEQYINEVILPSSPQSASEYWDRVAAARKVQPLKQPCGDCAISTGFYIDYADELAAQPEEMRNKVMDTWFCHNNCNRGCAGIREFIAAKGAAKEVG